MIAALGLLAVLVSCVSAALHQLACFEQRVWIENRGIIVFGNTVERLADGSNATKRVEQVLQEEFAKSPIAFCRGIAAECSMNQDVLSLRIVRDGLPVVSLQVPR